MLRSSVLLLVCAKVAAQSSCTHNDLPDQSCTPGAHFSGNDCGGAPCTADTLCVSGYSKTVRNVPTSLKQAVYEAYGLPGFDHTGFCNVDSGCEVDHLISLEIGGNDDQSNLWPQPYSGTQWNARVKDKLENKLKKEFCAGSITLDDAQTCIASDWIACYKKYYSDMDTVPSSSKSTVLKESQVVLV